MQHDRQQNSDLQKKLDSTREHLDLLKMVTEELSTELDLDKLLIQVAEKALELIHAETLVVPIIDPDRNHYTYKAASGKNAAVITGKDFPVSMGMCGWVLSRRQSLIFGKDLPWLMDEKNHWEEGMESALLVPLIARGEIVGGLSGLGKQGGGSFNQDDLDALQIFASQVSIAIDNARIVQELKQEKERTETTLNAIADGVITTDASGVIERANPVACQLLGWQAEDITGRPLDSVFKVVSFQDGNPVEDPVSKVLRSGERVEDERHTVLVDKAGKHYQIADNASPVRNQDGELEGAVLVFRDISGEFKLLEDLRTSEQKHRRLIEHLGDEFFMFVQDPSGALSFVSPSINRCLGYSQRDFMLHFQQYLTDNPLNQQIDLNFKLALEGTPPEPYEIEMLNKPGQKCKLRVSKTPVFDQDNNVIAVEGLVQNITQLKALEASVSQSQKLEAIGQLSSGVAHDFNNQLGVVMGYLDMLDDRFDPASTESRWVNTAIKSTQRCIELTQGLMSFSRTKLTRQSIISINDNLESMGSILRHALTNIIQLKMDLAESSTNVIADAGEFQDAILNLILNARDAMPEGGQVNIQTEVVTIEGSLHCFVNTLTTGRYIKLSIEDTGEGINPQLIKRIFEPFFTTKPRGQGTGMGISMVFGFINRVKGAIDVHSEQGKGTKFELYIPEVRQSAIPSEKSTEKTPLPEGHETILLVEDEQALRELSETNLKSLGYQVITASNAREALNYLKQDHAVDLLFSDVVMPGGMDGFELAYEACQLRPQLKVLMATGYASREGIEKARTEHNLDILYKPYSRSILAQRVRRVLDKVLDEDTAS